MTKVILNDFSGGIAEDVRELATDTFAVAKNIDVKAFKNKVTPYVATTTQAQNGNTYSMGAVMTTLSSGTQRLSFLGASDNSNYYPRFYGKSDSSLTSGVVGYTNGDPTTTGYKVAFGSLVSYKNKLICMGYSSTDAKMYSYDGASTTFATVGTISAYPTNISIPNIPKPFRHPADDILYGAAGNIVCVNNNGSFTAAGITLPSDCWITSLSYWGSYLAIATAPREPGGRSRVFLWGRDTSTTTFYDILDFGEGSLKVLENIDGALIGITISDVNYSVTPQLRMYVWGGGSPELKRTVTAKTYNSIGLEIFKAKQGNELYFTAKFPVQGTTVNQIWVAGKNRKGNWYMNPDRYVNGTTSITNVNGFDFVGDYLFVGYDSGSFVRTYAGGGGDTAVYTTSVLETLVNPNMTVYDRDKKKQLKAVSITTVTGGDFTLSYSVDGGAYIEIFTGAIAANTTREANRTSSGKMLDAGREFQFKLQINSQATSVGLPDITEFAYKYDIVNSINE